MRASTPVASLRATLMVVVTAGLFFMAGNAGAEAVVTLNSAGAAASAGLTR